MLTKSKNTFEIVGDEVHITRPEWSIVGLTTYREDYYSELTSKTWTLTKTNSDTDDKGYLSNKSLGLLHRYIAAKWYGEKMLKVMTAKGYIIDHMNNNHADCRVSNLEFLKKAYNTAKGQAFDVDSKTMEHSIAVNLFKDFSTGFYQITIGCNDDIIGETTNGNRFHVGAIMLLYDCDYSIVVNDAENILCVYEAQGRIDLGKTYACDVKIRKTVDIGLTEDTKNDVVAICDGVCYAILGTKKLHLKSVNYEKGWKPPENK